MIGFGELRKKSVEWQTELSTVERIYALGWVLKGIFGREALARGLALRGASALALAYFAEYPRVEEAEFSRDADLGDTDLESELGTALREAAEASGLQFRLHHFQSSEARVEFSGPMGRRSAAQPLIVLRFAGLRPRAELVARPLIHPFSDGLEVQVRAVALEELAAERIVLYAQKPRARDVFDLWFMLTHGAGTMNPSQLAWLAEASALKKGVKLQTEPDPNYVPLLERSWDNALREIRGCPAFRQAIAEIGSHLVTIVPLP